MSIEKLRGLDTEGLSITSAIELHTNAKAYAATFAEFGLPVPEWLTEAQRVLSDDIKAKRRDQLIARQRDLKAQRANLRTAEEKRKAIDDELAQLDGQLSA